MLLCTADILCSVKARKIGGMFQVLLVKSCRKWANFGFDIAKHIFDHVRSVVTDGDILTYLLKHFGFFSSYIYLTKCNNNPGFPYERRFTFCPIKNGILLLKDHRIVLICRQIRKMSVWILLSLQIKLESNSMQYR